VEFSKTAVDALVMHLSDRKGILTEYYERWKAYTDTGREFRTQWQQFVSDARQVRHNNIIIIIIIITKRSSGHTGNSSSIFISASKHVIQS